VANNIDVNGPEHRDRSDTDIAHAVRTVLESDVLVSHQPIRSTVSSGVVTLEGAAECYRQHDDIVRCVDNLAGVHEVRSLLVIEPTPLEVSPHVLGESIEQSLQRYAQDASNDIRIAVKDAEVIVWGAHAARSESR
jgi:osmotically-inducible protein OsmY